MYLVIKFLACWKNFHSLTELITTNSFKMHNVGLVKANHEGKCYKNTLYGPVIVEEYTCVDAAEALLFNKGGKFLGEDEAFFIDQLVIYGDTRGCKKFIDRQYKLLGALVEGIA